MPHNILVIAPHPDDEILGCGGTIARAVGEGDRVIVCIVTRGAPELFDDAFLEQGRAEARTVHAELGVETVFLDGYPAPLLDTVPRHRLADDLSRLVHAERVDTVYIPHRGDIHHDHALVHEAALVACRPIHGNPVRRVLAYETLSETEWATPGSGFAPTVFVDITATLDSKLRAMAGYASQIQQRPHPRSLDGIRALAALRGYTAGVAAAEAFALVREIR